MSSWDGSGSDFPGGSEGRESACNAGHPSLNPGSRRSPGEGTFLPGEFHGQRSLADYSLWGSQSDGHN